MLRSAQAEQRGNQPLVSKCTNLVWFDLVKTVLDQKRCAQLEERMLRQRKTGSNLNWAALLGFKELLLCARKLGALASEIADLDCLAKVRNLVCHAANEDLLVEQHSDVRRLAYTKTLCLKLLDDG